MTPTKPEIRRGLAHDRIGLAVTRLVNRDRTQPGTPERAAFVESIGLLLEAQALLCPDRHHPEAAEDAQNIVARACQTTS
jgi:hypothetical protein